MHRKFLNTIIIQAQITSNQIENILLIKIQETKISDWDIGLVEENEERKKRKELNEKKENEFHQRRQLYSENRDMESYANLEEEYEAWKEREKYIDRCSRVQQLKEKYKNSPTIKEILQQLKPYFIPDTLNTKLLTILTTLMQILSKACSIYNPQFIGYTIDGQQNKDKKLTFHSLFIYVFLRIGSYICKEQQNSFYIKVKSDASIRVAGKTFEHIHNLSHNWHLKKKMGVLQRSMQRGISASDSVVSYLFLYIVPSMIECFVVFIIFYKLFNLPEQTSIVFFFLASYVTITIQVTKSRKKYRRSSNEYDNQVNECTNDSFTNFESVKYFCNEKHETNKYIDKIKKYQNAYTITQYTLSIQNSQQSLCIHGCLLLSLFITCKRILNDNMTIGEFTTVNSYVISQFTPQSFLGTIYDTVLQSFVDIQNLQQLQNEVPEIYDKHNAKELNQINKNTNKKSAKIEFKNVYFNYPTQTKRYNIENLSFTIDEGTTTALVGATGSGKSTIGKLLFRFYDINSGNIYINDQDIRDITIKSLRDSIGVVPQDVTLFNDTIKYNIQYGNFTASFTEQERVCELARIYDFITDQKDQWDTVVGERGLRLSGGEKQRISIARALLKDPTIVLQDEATSAQDTINEREIQQALQNQQKDRTMVIIAHRLSTIRHADQILVLDNGKIVERGKHDEQQKLNGKYAELWRCQAQDLRELMSDDSVSNNSNGDDNIDNDNTINDISQNGIVSSKNNDLLSSLDLVSTKHNSRNKLNIDSDSFRHSILDTPVSSK